MYRAWIKQFLRNKHGIKEKKMVIAVGQFIPRKGFDRLIRAMQYLDNNIGVYIVGGEPTQEYIKLKQLFQLENLHFLGFKNRRELKELYLAADVFVHPTCEDIWGLVVNEALACGLPVVTTDCCIAGRELIVNGKNGYIIPAENENVLCGAIKDCFEGEEFMAHHALEAVKPYTIEDMAQIHISVLSCKESGE